MTTRASNWFERKYQNGAIHVLQSQGQLTRGMARTASSIKGNEVQWKIAGRGNATVMSTSIENRPTLNADRTTVLATMADYEANEWILTTDVEKMTEGEQQVAQETCGMAMGREMDKVLIRALDAGSVLATLGDGSAGFSPTVLLDAQTRIRAQGISGNPKMCVAVPFKWMGELMQYEEFSSSDYGGSSDLRKSMGAKTFLGMEVVPMPDEYFNVPSANQMHGYAWMPDVVGFATNYELMSRIDYVPEKKAYFAANTMGMCAATLLSAGVVKLHYATNAAFSLTP